MRNGCFVALAVALILGLSMADAEARPGGKKRGGGPKVGGGTRPAHSRPGNFRASGQVGQGARNLGGKLQSTAGNLNNGLLGNKASQLKTNLTPANQPFTPAWYADHPAAWRYTHPHADAWAVATSGAAAAWLGVSATGGVATVYTSETSDAEDPAADESASGDAAAKVAAEDEFLSLGVFALAPKSEQDAAALVQLAVSKQGELRGNYYDVLTGQEQTLAGNVDKHTKRATFRVIPNGNASFETTLANLTRSAGSVTLRFENGQTRQWTLARFDDAAPEPGHR